ncbi:hypothetical protein I7I53_00753 [Histoplasma capsulatum var. duboisii H88]|uniref:Uncharacterized protein n=1 Tax=Ajellomyces capsulatus (strain H88) TaxID=544711 RepID=A0A8A1LHF6_AJEC8|nr:hypothetical protein I7I53_00753 [Histoplasma capsulatum var. duboisii H88]
MLTFLSYIPKISSDILQSRRSHIPFSILEVAVITRKRFGELTCVQTSHPPFVLDLMNCS